MAPKNTTTMHDPSYSPPYDDNSPHYRRTLPTSTSTATTANSKSSVGSRSNEQPRSNRSSRSSRHQDPPTIGSSRYRRSSPSPPAAAAMARQQQRRRPTNYTSSYTPPASLVAHASQARDAREQNLAASFSRSKCSSLDRSEEDGDERRRHLKSGKGRLKQPGGGGGFVEGSGSGAPPVRRMQQQRHSHHEQYQLQQQEMQKQQQRQQRHPMHEQQQQMQNFQQKLERRDSHQHSHQGSSQRRGSSAGRRSSQVTQQHPPSGSHGRHPVPSTVKASSSNASLSSRHSQSSRTHRNGGSAAAAASPRHRPDSHGQQQQHQQQEDELELTEQQRIEEYAGQRALLRLEQELGSADVNNNEQSSPHSIQTKSVMDRKKLARVPQVKKSDLIIGQYLGRGNFCDVFEVTWTLPEQRSMMMQSTGNNWNSNRTMSTYGDDYESDNDNGSRDTRENLEASMNSLALSCSNDLSLLGVQKGGGAASRRSVSQIRTSFHGSSSAAAATMANGTTVRLPMRYGNNNNATAATAMRNPNVLALKCLRPAVRAKPRKFVIGAEDLAHETALLACLDHPNIIQLYGRAEGCFSTAFQMRASGGNPKQRQGKQMSNEGYFIILDRLMAVLTDRIDEWKDECRAINGVAPPGGTPVPLPPETTLREHLCNRLKVAYCIADALEYLHSRHVVFRDLKPANIGFDCNDCVKMFDFGFATSIAPLLNQPYEGYGPLTETCGTRRYMAPEVALKLGYGKEVDVYSFGMLLWEICALDKPFDSIQSVAEFHDVVVLCGKRPNLNIDPLWTKSLKSLMCRCWSTDPLDRPTMVQVKSLLCNVLRDMNKAAMNSGSSSRSGRGGGGSGDNKGGTQQQRQEQGGNFIHKWRRRVSI